MRNQATPFFWYMSDASGAPVPLRRRADQTNLRHSSPSPQPGNRNRPAFLEAATLASATRRVRGDATREGTEKCGPHTPPETPCCCCDYQGDCRCGRPRARSEDYCSTSRRAARASAARSPDRRHPPAPLPYISSPQKGRVKIFATRYAGISPTAYGIR